MAKAQSIWSKADNFLTTTRKIIVNVFTGLILVVLTFAIIGGIGSAFTTETKIAVSYTHLTLPTTVSV